MSIFLLVASRKGSIIASPTCSCRNGLGAQVSLALVVKAKNRSELAIFLRALTRKVAVGLQPLFHRVQQAIDELIHATDHVKAFMLVVFQSLSYPGFKFYPLRMVHVDLLNRFDAGLRQDAPLPDRAEGDPAFVLWSVLTFQLLEGAGRFSRPWRDYSAYVHLPGTCCASCRAIIIRAFGA
jgi:hypothetical protein